MKYGVYLLVLFASSCYGMRLRQGVCRSRNTYYGVEGSCQSYVECVDYAPVQKQCSNGYYYNAAAAWPDEPCGHPSETQCVGRRPAPGPETKPARLETRPHVCKARYTYHAVEGSCGSYVECVDHAPALKQCGENEHYNAEAVWPEHPCGHVSIVSCAAPPPEPAPNRLPAPTPNPEPTTRPAPKPARFETRPPHVCKARYTYHAVEGSCGSYVECVDHAPALKQCGENEHYNAEAVWPEHPCGHVSIVYCTAPPPEPAPNRLPAPTFKPAPTTRPAPKPARFETRLHVCKARYTYHAVEGSCGSYVECVDHAPALKQCGENEHYNAEAVWPEHPCGHVSIVSCAAPPPEPAPNRLPAPTTRPAPMVKPDPEPEPLEGEVFWLVRRPSRRPIKYVQLPPYRKPTPPPPTPPLRLPYPAPPARLTFQFPTAPPIYRPPPSPPVYHPPPLPPQRPAVPAPPREDYEYELISVPNSDSAPAQTPAPCEQQMRLVC